MDAVEDYARRWKKREVDQDPAVTSQRVLKVLFYVNILQCFFVVENFTANAISVAIGDNGNRLIFEIWWNIFYDLFSIKNVADVNSIDSLSLFNTIPRTKRSHGHKRIQHPNIKKSSKPRTLQDTFNDLLSNIQKPLACYHE
jgi:hypothetical protein